MTKFSLCFITWNAEGRIQDSLETISAQKFDDYEVVIIDNDSDDDTVGVVESYRGELPSLSIQQNETNQGFSKAANAAAELADGEFICLYNHDTHFPSEYLTTLADTVTLETVWTTSRINHQVSTTKRTVRYLGHWGFPMPYDVGGHQGTVETNYVPGDGLIVPSEIYDRLGSLFDESLPPKGEDVDLSLRLRAANIPMRAILDTHSVHPDTGIYETTLSNGLRLLSNVRARWKAYGQNPSTFGEKAGVIASAVAVPSTILFGESPRASDRFAEESLYHHRELWARKRRLNGH